MYIKAQTLTHARSYIKFRTWKSSRTRQRAKNKEREKTRESNTRTCDSAGKTVEPRETNAAVATARGLKPSG